MLSQHYDYDGLNRLFHGYTSGPNWGEVYGRDTWGNLISIGPYHGNPRGGFSASVSLLNRLVGYGHDPAGNMTSNGSASYTYDAENRLSLFGGTYSYVYDGDGKRVKKCSNSGCTTGTLYFTGTSSDALLETDVTGAGVEEYIFFGGKRIARRDNTGGAVHYYFSDHLGSHTVIESGDGNACEHDIDYYPYGGQEQDYCSGAAQNYEFTGKERDTESGLDNFMKRYHASSLGRFMTPDPVGVIKQKLLDPQQWNMYSYARNNPLRFVDPTGQYVCDGNKDQCARIKTALSDAQKAASNLKDSKEKSALEKAISFYGKEGEKNGVTVKFGDLSKEGAVAVTSSRSFFGFFKRTDITFDTKAMDRQLGAVDDAGTAAHEGAHGVDQWAAGGHNPTRRADVYQTELNGAHAEAYVAKGFGTLNAHGTWNGGWTDANNPDMEKAVQREAEAATERDCQNGGCN